MNAPPSIPSGTRNSATGLLALSPGALAGIGAGSGIFGIGVIVAVIVVVVRLLFNYKRRLDTLERMRREWRTTVTYEDHTDEIGPDMGGLHEVSGIGIVREMPDDPLFELPVPAAELPIDNQ
jgi:hypothetical protein